MPVFRLLVGINCTFSTDPPHPILNGSALEVTRLNWATGQTFLVLPRQVFEGYELLKHHPDFVIGQSSTIFITRSLWLLGIANSSFYSFILFLG